MTKHSLACSHASCVPMYSAHYAQAYYQHTPTPPPQPPRHGPWYQPGNARCTHRGCSFTGSGKAVEIHMMDRHLIFPPGWEQRNRAQDWDADPSLKNGSAFIFSPRRPRTYTHLHRKPIPIMGTTLVLDTPESIHAWIEERKRRFPTAARVQDKQLKLEEALTRGQIMPEKLGLRGVKRPRDNERPGERARGTARGRGRGRGNRPPPQVHPLPMKPQFLQPVPGPSSQLTPDFSSDSDMEPETVSSKRSALAEDIEMDVGGDSDAPPEVAPILKEESVDSQPENTRLQQQAQVQREIKSIRRPHVPQPKPSTRNPFSSRPSLLRNVCHSPFSIARPSIFISDFIVALT